MFFAINDSNAISTVLPESSKIASGSRIQSRHNQTEPSWKDFFMVL